MTSSVASVKSAIAMLLAGLPDAIAEALRRLARDGIIQWRRLTPRDTGALQGSLRTSLRASGGRVVLQ